MNRIGTRLAMPCLLWAAACGGAGAGTVVRGDPPSFDAERAWQHMEKMVAIGPREAGSPGAEATRRYIEAELKKMGLAAVREPFSASTPAGRLEMCNLHVTLPGTGGKQARTILVGSHYDTKRMPFRFDGANDGASSTAALIELARVLKDRPSAFHYRLIFLDGEEAVEEWVDPDNRYGSRFHARELQRTGEVARIAAFILLDMIADKDLTIEQDENSDRTLLGLFIRAAQELGYGKHFQKYPRRVLDDHLSFRAIGIPSVDLIDLEFGPDNDYWHSSHDKLENCSPESVRITAEIFLATLPKLEAHLAESADH